MIPESCAPGWLWGVFAAIVVGFLAVDLGVLHRKAREVGLREAALWSLFWFLAAFAFAAISWPFVGAERSLEFVTAYLVEKTLSVDNVFAFVVIFGALGTPRPYQHRVLFWGILGALGLRAVFVLAGTALLTKFAWLTVVFGAILALTGIKMALVPDKEPDPEQNFLVRAFRRLVSCTRDYRGTAFWVRENGRLTATPLLAALVAVEGTDLVFAADSMPAVLAVSRDPFVVYTSNVFSILGLRQLYFVLAGAMTKLPYLRHGLAAVLVFVGAKMLAGPMHHLPAHFSLAGVVLILGASIVASLVALDRKPVSEATPARSPELTT
jgi:tellurite resistance protein TerC